MRRILVSLLFALLLVWSIVGLKNIAAHQAGGHAPVALASGGSPPPPR
jgi:hypothetical protein